MMKVGIHVTIWTGLGFILFITQSGKFSVIHHFFRKCSPLSKAILMIYLTRRYSRYSDVTHHVCHVALKSHIGTKKGYYLCRLVKGVVKISHLG